MADKFLDKVYDLGGNDPRDIYAKWSGTYDSEVSSHGYATPARCAKALSQFVPDLIEDVLDYGCGGSDWNAPGFANGISAVEFFGLRTVHRYEPARDIDERALVDCVVCFDVLEHVYVSDVAAVLRDILSHANKLVILNVACYEANALLPNGENAHITVRNPHWWKGVLDTISVEFPAVSIDLICSPQYNQMQAFPTFSDQQRQADDKFCIAY